MTEREAIKALQKGEQEVGAVTYARAIDKAIEALKNAGEWILNDCRKYYNCSVCGKGEFFRSKNCPECGASMRNHHYADKN